VQRKARVRRETKVFGQSIVAGAGSRLRLPHAILQLTFACLGLVPDHYPSLPHFASPPVSRATESLLLRAVAWCCPACTAYSSTSKRCVYEEVSLGPTSKVWTFCGTPCFGSSFGVETARANHHHCMSLYMLLRVIPLLIRKSQRT
jgi:hypothetical protein